MNFAAAQPDHAPPRSQLWRWLAVLFLFALGLNWINRFVLNTDALAYLRLGEYYATGRANLMVSGYWGPLFSWLVAPWIAVGVTPLFAGRIVMILSALAFFSAGWRLLSLAGVGERGCQLGNILGFLAAGIWSAQNVTPDLLMAAFAVGAIGQLLAPDWPVNGRRPFWAGALWALAYLGKPVALPWAGVTLLVFGFLRRRRAGEFRSIAMSIAILGLLTLPWITVLSLKYGHPTFSTSGKIAHALVGPGAEQRYHPSFVTLHSPDNGRVTSWEDPTGLSYRPWSPLASSENFSHQLKLISANAGKAGFLLFTVSLWWPLVIVRRTVARQWELLLPLALLVAIYLPVYLAITEQRYLYAALPLLWAALNRGALTAERGNSRLAMILFLSFLLPLGAIALKFQWPERIAGRQAHELAETIKSTGRPGPVAGSALQPGGRTGLYVAWFLGQPWHGDHPQATAADFVKSGARWLVFNSNDPRVTELEQTQGVRKLLFNGSALAHLVVFEVR